MFHDSCVWLHKHIVHEETIARNYFKAKIQEKSRNFTPKILSFSKELHNWEKDMYIHSSILANQVRKGMDKGWDTDMVHISDHLETNSKT